MNIADIRRRPDVTVYGPGMRDNPKVIPLTPAERDALCDAAEREATLRAVFLAVIEWQGIDHPEPDCPMDDTCTCPLIKRVNEVLK